MRIVIAAGFLGSGKTTRIHRFLKEQSAFRPGTIVVVENDFGPVNLDAELLSDSGVRVRSLDSGCICCTISGDFSEAIEDIAKEWNPELVLIEPSGVAMLSDLLEQLGERRFLGDTLTAFCAVDGARWEIDLENSGKYFEDQILNADFVLVNRADSLDAILEEFPGLIVYADESYTTEDLERKILGKEYEAAKAAAAGEEHDGERSHCGCGHAHEHDDHDHEHCDHDHDHDHHDHHDHDHHDHDHDHDHHDHAHAKKPGHADFVAYEVRPDTVAVSVWKKRFGEEGRALLEKNGCVRVKGIVNTAEGPKLLQWAGMGLEVSDARHSELSGRLAVICRRSKRPDPREISRLLGAEEADER